MPDNSFSRRGLIAAAAAAVPAAAAQAPRQPVVASPPQGAGARAQQAPIKVVTTYKFEPHEIQRIQDAVPNAKIDIEICANRDEFRLKIRDAEVVYGDIRAADLDFAPRLKWVQAGGAGMEGMLLNDDKWSKSDVVLTNYAHDTKNAVWA